MFLYSNSPDAKTGEFKGIGSHVPWWIQFLVAEWINSTLSKSHELTFTLSSTALDLMSV